MKETDNGIGYAGASQLSEALKANTSLTVLDVSRNGHRR